MNRYRNTKERIFACQRRVSRDGETDKVEDKNNQPKKKQLAISSPARSRKKKH